MKRMPEHPFAARQTSKIHLDLATGAHATLMLRLALIASAVALSACSNQRQGGAVTQPLAGVVHGAPVKKSHPLAKHLVGVVDDKGACTGTLIGKRSVLTAAHCLVRDGSAGATRIVFSTDLDSPSAEKRWATDVVMDPEYVRDPETGYDIAVLRFDGEPPAGYEPFRLEHELPFDEGTDVILLGYGRTSLENEDSLGRLRLGRGYVKGDLHRYIPYFSMASRQGTISCAGDSGGPIFVEEKGKYMLAGVVNSGSDCDGKGTTLAILVSRQLAMIRGALDLYEPKD